ncbi:outer membrane beta-barrel protein [Flavobacterium defluvii]|uniref:Outer membrane protein beta-barrel domain-containing protein n=1 Tax=Flavobacterium defluvii TaxID=370979 RepID=A0A1M5Q3L4_9FLAO|nr:outer membrane beta-barrel protein [Flavobacterium defluvii]SHH08562.1 Outer membrane protein beta-barrel domain-containing protein [Flavobacterium defluvii]
MKKPLLLLLFILSMHSYAQITFEKGYFIDNNDKKTECLIKNLDWRNNPTEFEYKLDEQDQSQKINITQAKEFGIYKVSKYIRQTVNIDRSRTILSELDYDKSPKFNEEKLFLKVLIEGKANLYEYENSDISRFFFKTENTPITQLICKSYKISDTEVGENNTFRNQIYTELKCENINIQSIKYLNYTKAGLSKIFAKYNQCQNSEFTNFETTQKKDLFNLTIRPGIKNSSFSAKNAIYTNYNADFGSKIGFRLGVEAEMILPFNKNKWAIIIEPTYQSYKAEDSQPNLTSKIDYSSIELPIGIRHYFFLNNTSKIFVNAQYQIDIAIKNKASFKVTNLADDLNVDSSGGITFGLGYNYKKKYSTEFRMGLSRDLFSKYGAWTSDYKTIALIFGYTIF